MAKRLCENVKKNSPLKIKVIRGNHKLFITKKFEKGNNETMNKKRANISNNPEIMKLYKIQRNYVVNLSRKVKAEYYQKHVSHGAYSKHFLEILQTILFKYRYNETRQRKWSCDLRSKTLR